GEAVEGGGQRRRAIEPDGVFLGADFDGAGGKDEALGIDGETDVGGGDALGVEGLWVEVYRDLAGLAAIGQRKTGALHVSHLGADGVVAEIVELLLGEGVAGDAELQ